MLPKRWALPPLLPRGLGSTRKLLTELRLRMNKNLQDRREQGERSRQWGSCPGEGGGPGRAAWGRTDQEQQIAK